MRTKKEMIWHNDLIFEVQQIYRNVRHNFLTDMKPRNLPITVFSSVHGSTVHTPPTMIDTYEALTDLNFDGDDLKLLTEGKSRVKCSKDRFY